MNMAAASKAALMETATPIALPAITIPTLGNAPSRADWDRAFRQMTARKAAFNADCRRHDEVHAAWEAGKPDEKMIDWGSFPFVVDRYRLTRKADLDQMQATYERECGVTWWARDPAASIAKYAAALDTVREYRRLADDNDRLHAIHELTEQNDRLGEALTKAEEALLLTPAPSGEELLFKIEFAFERDWDDEATRDAIRADARRLLSAGRA